MKSKFTSCNHCNFEIKSVKNRKKKTSEADQINLFIKNK